MGTFIDGIKNFYFGKSLLVRLILINVAVFVTVYAVVLLSRLAGGAVNPTGFLKMPSDIAGLLYAPWTAVTYMFTHDDFFHIFFNMLWLYCFGMIYLDLYSDRSLVWTYLAGGLGGAVCYLSVSAFSNVGSGLVGASAAVLAVAAAAVVRKPDYRINLFLVGMVKIKWLALAFVAFALLTTSEQAVGSNAAHLGGIAAGAIVALNARYGFFRRRRRRKAIVLPPLHTEPVVSQQELERRLDALLDKIRVSGYNSLSAREKQELNELSEKIK